MGRPRLLITGVTGFVGKHLLAATEIGAYRVFGAGRSPRPKNGAGRRMESYVRGDLSQPAFANRLIRRVRPDRIIHLAGLSRCDSKSPTHALRRFLAANVVPTIRLIEATAAHAPHARMVIVGSSAEYGLSRSPRHRFRETSNLRPRGGYGLSKFIQTAVALRLSGTSGLHLCIARPFNILGPDPSPGLFWGAFLGQIARNANPVRLGPLDAMRDFMDVEDLCRGLLLICEKGIKGEIYNFCTGIGHTPRQLVRRAERILGRTLVIRRNTAIPSDAGHQVGSFVKIKKMCGWTPRVSLDEALQRSLKHAFIHTKGPAASIAATAPISAALNTNEFQTNRRNE